MMHKRVLLGTTAILGVGLLTAGAPTVAGAAEVRPGGALDIVISGFARFRAHAGDFDEARNNDDLSTGLDFSNDTEVHVLARGKHETTGIEYGGTVEFEADTNRTDNTDETWLFLRGGFGEVRLGDEDGVADNDGMAISAARIVAGTGGFDGSVTDLFATGTNDNGATFQTKVFEPLNTSDATKIRYYTPSFGGLQFGVAYTPNQAAIDSGGGNGDTLAGTDVAVGDVVEAGVIYKGNVGGFDTQASVVGLTGDVKDEDITGGDDYWALQGGALVDVYGFKVAGSYLTEELGGIEIDAITLGVGATLGPVNTAVHYGRVLDGEDLPDGADNPSSLILAADVTLMPGLVLGGDINFFDNDDDDNGDGVMGVGTLRLTF